MKKLIYIYIMITIVSILTILSIYDYTALSQQYSIDTNTLTLKENHKLHNEYGKFKTNSIVIAEFLKAKANKELQESIDNIKTVGRGISSLINTLISIF